MFRDRDIIVIGPEWNILWQGSQEIATRFAAAGNRVLYVENLGIRAPALRDAGRVFSRLARWLRSRKGEGLTAISERLHLRTPLVAPPFGPPWQRAINRLLLRRIAAAARSLGMTSPVIISYLPTDTAGDLIDLVRGPSSVVVLYYTTDFSQHASNLKELRASEERLLRAADLVLAQESTLAEHCRRFSSNVHVVPHGVAIEAFPILGEPAKREANWPPVIGYVGGLHKALDTQLVRDLVGARRDWTWEFVGSVQIDPALLPSASNVVFTGAKPHAELIHFLRRFDVCIIPYREDPFTAVVVPTKLNEYLAAGKPVVSTRIPSVVEFNREHNVVYLAEARSDQFIAAIEQALAEGSDPALPARRRGVAEQSDWTGRLELIARLIEEAPGRP